MARPAPWTAAAMLAAAGLLPSATSTAALRPPPTPPAPMMVVLEGEIDVGGTHAGVLELRLGDGVLHAVPAGPGPFQLLLPAGASPGMVSLEYSAPGVRLRSLLGGHARLTRLAGPDARLTMDEEGGLRLSPLSTAIAVGASAVDGVVPATDGEFAAAIRAARMQDIVLAATALERYAVEPARLPEGFDDGLALVGDSAAFAAAMRADPSLVESPHLVIDALPAPAATARDLAPVLVLTGPRGVPGSPPSGPGLVLEAEGKGVRLHGLDFDGPGYSTHFDAVGAVLLVPDAPLASFAGYLPCAALGGQEVMAIRTVVQRDLRRHWRGTGMSLWQLGTDAEIQLHDCPGATPQSLRWIELWASPEIPRARVHDPSAWLAGGPSLPLFCGVLYPHHLAVEACGQAVHLLSRDGTGTALPDDGEPMPLTWRRDATGAIRLDYGEGRASRLWLIDAGDGPTQALAWVAEAEVVGYPGTGSGHAIRILGGRGDRGAHDAAAVCPPSARRVGWTDEYDPCLRAVPRAAGPGRLRPLR